MRRLAGRRLLGIEGYGANCPLVSNLLRGWEAEGLLVVSESSDTRDRVIRLEANLLHVTDQLDDMTRKLNEMHDVMMQMKGAKWVIWTAAGMLGSLFGIGAWLLPSFLNK